MGGKFQRLVGVGDHVILQSTYSTTAKKNQVVGAVATKKLIKAPSSRRLLQASKNSSCNLWNPAIYSLIFGIPLCNRLKTLL